MVPGVDSFLTTLTIWTGASVGLLKVFDWLLREKQKDWVSDKATHFWLWLEDQRAGKFISIFLMRKAQVAFVVITHVSLILIVGAFLARVFLGWDIPANIQLGHPRLYPFQVWIDVVALVASAFLLSWKIHPKISGWIGSARTLWRYFGRSGIALFGCVLTAFGYLLLLYPIIGFGSPAFTLDDPDQIVAAYESMLGGKPGVVAVHGFSAAIAAPIFAEWLMVQTILFLSFYWLLLVWIVMFLFRVLQFVLIRIVESPNGPVLALSGFLIGVGAIAKAVSG